MLATSEAALIPVSIVVGLGASAGRLKPGAGDDWMLFNGLSVIATGLEILSAELKATRKEIAELKTLLQQPPKRTS